MGFWDYDQGSLRLFESAPFNRFILFTPFPFKTIWLPTYLPRYLSLAPLVMAERKKENGGLWKRLE